MIQGEFTDWGGAIEAALQGNSASFLNKNTGSNFVFNETVTAKSLATVFMASKDVAILELFPNKVTAKKDLMPYWLALNVLHINPHWLYLMVSFFFLSGTATFCKNKKTQHNGLGFLFKVKKDILLQQ